MSCKFNICPCPLETCTYVKDHLWFKPHVKSTVLHTLSNGKIGVKGFKKHFKNSDKIEFQLIKTEKQWNLGKNLERNLENGSTD